MSVFRTRGRADEAGHLVIQDGYTTTVDVFNCGPNDGGNVRVGSTGTVRFEGGTGFAGISTTSAGEAGGNAGDIDVFAPLIEFTSGGILESDTGSVNPGHGLRIGLEPTARLLADATRFQLAARVLREAPGPYPALTRSFPDLVSDLLTLDGELAEHLVAPDRLRAHDVDLLRTRAARTLGAAMLHTSGHVSTLSGVGTPPPP